jgi:hypothetical protein
MLREREKKKQTNKQMLREKQQGGKSCGKKEKKGERNEK